MVIVGCRLSIYSMKTRSIISVALTLLMLGVGTDAMAHRTRVYIGASIGGPVWGPGWGPGWGPVWYPPPYYYPPQVVVVPPSQPPVYVEQAEPAAPQPAQTQQYWYYCKSAKGYYPYVKECSEGWQKVLPQPEK